MLDIPNANIPTQEILFEQITQQNQEIKIIKVSDLNLDPKIVTEEKKSNLEEYWQYWQKMSSGLEN